MNNVSASASASSKGIGAIGLLWVVLIGLKLFGVAALESVPWFVVILWPIAFFVTVALIFFLVLLIIFMVASLMDRR